MFKRIFLDHSSSADETYFERMIFATKFSFTLGVACLMAIVHAFIPCLFEKSASAVVARLYAKTSVRSIDEPTDAKSA
nr:DUF6356 family protein [uncultured Tateyamaria sp.]